MATSNYRIVILPQAENDIEETLKYIAEKLHNQTAAINLLESIQKTIESISHFPYSRPTIKNESVTLGAEYRRADIDNFVLIYKAVAEVKEVRIMAAFYGSSDVIARILNRI